ncbi:MAG: hypothetical protein GTN81_15775 [Proteobacteria bacterium]|nr:hypothetical protein [Pseudomonadota bacterium]
MIDLRSQLKTAIMMITHDLGVIAEMADDVVVMYLGRGVEESSVSNLFHDARHPYTQGLLESVPSVINPSTRLEPIKGIVPDALDLPPGCRFEPRCPKAMEICRRDCPSLTEVASNHWVACWLYE